MLFSAKALIQFPNVNKDLFIFAPSINLNPLFFVVLALSLPAKSIKFNFPNFTSLKLFSLSFSLNETFICKIACDLELVLLASVSSTVLFLFPFFNKVNISFIEFVIISVILFIIIPSSGSSLNSKFSFFSFLLLNKSLIFSLYISTYQSFIKYSLFLYSLIFLYNSFKVHTIIPGFSSLPNIVYVLPAPVTPYANTVALKPFITLSIKNFVVLLNICSCPTEGEKAKSKFIIFSFPLILFGFKKLFGSFNLTILSSSILTVSFEEISFSFLLKGRHLTATKIL